MRGEMSFALSPKDIFLMGRNPGSLDLCYGYMADLQTGTYICFVDVNIMQITISYALKYPSLYLSIYLCNSVFIYKLCIYVFIVSCNAQMYEHSHYGRGNRPTRPKEQTSQDPHSCPLHIVSLALFPYSGWPIMLISVMRAMDSPPLLFPLLSWGTEWEFRLGWIKTNYILSFYVLHGMNPFNIHKSLSSFPWINQSIKVSS